MSHDLSSSKYFEAAPPPPLPLSGAPAAAPSASGYSLFRACRTVSMFVFIAVFTCGGVLLWTNRDEMNDRAKSVRRRTSNPIDLMLWLGGSDKTFEDAIVEASERQREEWDRIAEENKFEGLDLEELENGVIPLYNPESDFDISNDFSSDFEQ